VDGWGRAMTFTIQTNTVHASDEKLGELILYISQKSAFDEYFGATKLNKVLYFSDFIAYRNWDKPITGAEYFHLPQGPAPRRLVPVRSKLIAEEALIIQPVVLVQGWTQHRPVNLREPDLEIFSAREIALVDQVIDKLRGVTATGVSNLSHLELGWKLTRPGETIEYGTVFLSDAPLSNNEINNLQEAVVA
jgi:hypothetical protein